MAHRFMLGAGQYAGKLLVQLHPVGDEDDFIILEFGIPAQLQHKEHHGQRFARTLGVPDHAAPVVAFLFRLQPFNGLMYGAILLVTADFLDHLAVAGLKDREVADDVQQIFFPEYALQQKFLAAGSGKVSQRQRIGVLPFHVMLGPGPDGAHPGFPSAGGHQERIVIEQLLRAFL